MGCLYLFAPDARAALLHQDRAARAAAYACIASDEDTLPESRKFCRRMARNYASDARRHFAQWQDCRRETKATTTTI